MLFPVNDIMCESLMLRKAERLDAEMLLDWRNDPVTRQASHAGSIVEVRDHLNWLEKVFSDNQCHLFVAECDGEPVGTIRANWESSGEWKLSWTTAPNARGKGVAKKMLRVLLGQIRGPACAEVKSINKASCRVAESAGMVMEREIDGVCYFFRG